MASTSPLVITPEIAELITGAMDSGNILLLAAVDAEHKPVLSYRGSVAVFGDTQLSFWARNAAGGTIEAIRQNPQVALMYRSQTVPLLQFSGRAHVTDSAEERDRAFSLAQEREQKSDPERKGLAVIVDLDEVKGVLGFTDQGPRFCHMVRGV
jgi:hypothetical protein